MPRLRGFKWSEWALDTADRFYRDAPACLAVDTETSGFTFQDFAFCATVAWVDSDGRVQSGYFELSDGVAASQLAGMLIVAEKLVFHNAKFDLQKLIQAGILHRDALTPECIIDTECIAHLLDEHQPKKLKVLARVFLGEETDEDAAVSKEKKRVKKELGLRSVKEVGYHLLRREVIVPYAIKDAEFTIRLYERLWPELRSESGLSELFAGEMALVLATLDMESQGNRIDVPYLHKAIKATNTEVLRHELRINELTGLRVWYPEKSGQKTPEGCINPNANGQVLEAIRARGVDIPNTKKDTLKPLDDELATTVVGLRLHKKLLDTYLLNLEKERAGGDIVHPNFKLFRPKTGRTSSAGEDGD